MHGTCSRQHPARSSRDLAVRRPQARPPAAAHPLGGCGAGGNPHPGGRRQQRHPAGRPGRAGTREGPVLPFLRAAPRVARCPRTRPADLRPRLPVRGDTQRDAEGTAVTQAREDLAPEGHTFEGHADHRHPPEGGVRSSRGDVLLATAGAGRLSRFVPTFHRQVPATAFASFMTYRGERGPVLVAAHPEPRAEPLPARTTRPLPGLGRRACMGPGSLLGHAPGAVAALRPDAQRPRRGRELRVDASAAGALVRPRPYPAHRTPPDALP